MICIKLSGGLGNQMFQYACGRSIAHKHQTELLLDISLLKRKETNSSSTKRKFELNIFQLNAQIASKEDVQKLKSIFYRFANILSLRAGYGGIQDKRYFIERKIYFEESIKKVGEDCYLSGYWQNERYFQSVDYIIRKDFQFHLPTSNNNKDLLRKIHNENSISLHIRRSDFANGHYHAIHGVCSIEYYINASKYISENFSNPFFFIFSDDICWARENLKLSYGHRFIDENVGEQSYIDMLLMSNCKHNIIANSSFSWWGAWLNPNPNKVVIAPKQWFANEKLNAQAIDLVPPKWIRL